MFEVEKIHCLIEVKAETREFTFGICIWKMEIVKWLH